MNIGINRIPNIDTELSDKEFSEKHNTAIQNISVIMQCSGILGVSLTIPENSNKIVDVEIEPFPNLPKTNRDLLELPRMILARIMSSSGIIKAVLTATDSDMMTMRSTWNRIEELIKAGKENNAINVIELDKTNVKNMCKSKESCSCSCNINR